MARREASTPIVGNVSFVVLIAVAASGCTSHSFKEVRRPLTRPELPAMQAEPRASSRSDRLRGSLAQALPPLPVPERGGPTADAPTPGRPLEEPARAQERAQPQQPA